MTLFVVELACGCPCSLLRAENRDRAAVVLFGTGRGLRHRITGCSIVEVDRHRYSAVQRELTAAPGRRWQCRAQHEAPV